MIYKALKELSQDYPMVAAYGSSDDVLLFGGSERVLSIQKSHSSSWRLIDEFLVTNRYSYITGYIGYGVHEEYKKESNIPVCTLFAAEKVMRFSGFQKSKNKELHEPRCAGDFSDVLNNKRLKEQINKIIDWCRENPEQNRATLCHKIKLPIDVDLMKIFAFPHPQGLINTYPFVRSIYFKFSNIVEYAGMSPELLINFTFPVLKTYKLSGTILINDCEFEDIYSKTLKEHAMTILSLKDILYNLGDIYVDGPKQLVLSKIVHLYSIITIRTKTSNLTDILRKLLMKGTYPSKEGIHMLSNVEDFDRGPYYGNHVVIYPDGRCEASQILRCIFKSNGKTYSIAGASINAFSHPDYEMEEIHSKFKEIFFYD